MRTLLVLILLLCFEGTLEARPRYSVRAQMNRYRVGRSYSARNRLQNARTPSDQGIANSNYRRVLTAEEDAEWTARIRATDARMQELNRQSLEAQLRQLEASPRSILRDPATNARYNALRSQLGR